MADSSADSATQDGALSSLTHPSNKRSDVTAGVVSHRPRVDMSDASVQHDSERPTSVVHRQSNIRHNLLTVPPEILEAIAEQCEAQDLKNLRLVSRHVASAIIKPYTTAHFTERAFLMSSEPRLRTLLAIANSNTFGPKLKRIILCVDSSEREHAEFQEMFEDDAFLMDYYEECKSLFSLTSAQDVTRYLKAVFSKLKEHGNQIALEITHQSMTSRPAHGNIQPKSMRPVLYTTNYHYGPQFRSIAIALVFLALVESAFEIVEFRGYGKYWSSRRAWTGGHWAPNLHDWKGAGYTFDMFSLTKSVFQPMKTLYLDGYDTVSRKPPHPNYDEHVAAFSNSKSLENIFFQMGTNFGFPGYLEIDSGNQRLAMTFLNSTFPAIKSLTLGGFLCEAEQLIAFIERHSTLEKLNLRYLCISKAADFLNSSLPENTPSESQPTYTVEMLKAHGCNAQISVEQCRVIHGKPEIKPNLTGREGSGGTYGRSDDSEDSDDDYY